MAIDLGDDPGGTPPSPAEKLQIRTAIGLGQTDAPTFASLTVTTTAGANVFSTGSAALQTAGYLGVARAINLIDTAGISWSSTSTLLGATGTNLLQDAAGILAQRNGTNAQAFRVYDTYDTAGTNYERATFGFPTGTNTLRIGTEQAGTGAAQPIDFVVGGVAKINIGGTTVTMKSHVELEAAYTFGWVAAKGTTLYGGLVNGNLRISNYNGDNFGLLQFGNSTSAFPALKRSTTAGQTTYLQARLADDSTFTNIQGKLTTDTAYTATVVVPTGFLTLYDSTGTAYRVPCVV